MSSKPISARAAAADGGCRWLRRLAAVLRSRPGTVIVVAAAVVAGGAGVAGAANGGNFILGRANTETAPASLSNTHGVPLKLSAPSGVAPMQVNRTTMIAKLNAQYVGGLSATQLEATGGDGSTAPNTDTPIDREGDLVTATAALPAGVYYVSATALLDVASGDAEGICIIAKASAPGAYLQFGGEIQEGLVQAAETVAVTLTAGDSVQEWCAAGGDNGSTAINAGITAIKIQARHPLPGAARRPGKPAALPWQRR